MSRGSLALAAFLALTVACAPAEQQSEAGQEEQRQEQEYAASEEARVEFERFVQAWFTAFNAEDAATLTDMYTEDAVRMPPGAPAIRGREAIRAGFDQEFGEMSAPQIRGQTDDVHFAGDWAVERGNYTFSGTVAESDQQVSDDGKYVVVARKAEDGSWKIFWEIWNSNTTSGTMPEGTASGGGGQ